MTTAISRNQEFYKSLMWPTQAGGNASANQSTVRTRFSQPQLRSCTPILDGASVQCELTISG